MNRIDVEWGPQALDRAAQILVQRMGQDAGSTWFVLPSRRGVRKFREALARHLPAHLEPPQGIPQSAWLNVFRPSEVPAVDRHEAVHVWAACLREWSGADFRRAFGRERPAPEAAMAWFHLGQRARDLHVEVVQAGLGFDHLSTHFPEGARRWDLWAGLQSRYRERLASQGLCDGFEARAAAPVRGQGQVVLVFVPTANAVERATLEALGERATALVLCDQAHAHGFDEQGFLVPSAWSQADLPLGDAEWWVEPDPKAQAAAVERCLAAWSAERPTAPHDVVLGAPDPEVRPFLARRMARWPAELHEAAGAPLAQTLVAEGLRSLAALLPDWRYGDSARWLRHPDVQAWLGRNASAGLDSTEGVENTTDGPAAQARSATTEHPGTDHSGTDLAGTDHLGTGPPETDPAGEPAWDLPRLDRFQQQHLPLHLRSLPSFGASAGLGRSLQAGLHPLREVLEAGLGGEARPLPGWADALRDWLSSLYAGREWDETHPQDAAEARALEACAETLDRWQASRADWWPEVTASAALQWLLAEWQGQSAPLPAPEARESVITLEWLGWHELLWDDAPDLIVTGFQEGAVPEPVQVDVLLNPAQRRQLGLLESEGRAVRDQFLLHALLRCRRRVALVTGRKSAEGEPLRPSRLAFFRPDEEVPAALQRAFPEESEVPPPPVATEPGAARALPLLPKHPPLERLSVTDFQTYLESPYLFYLQRFLRLDTLDDLGRELDGRAFGTLVHTVLERWGLGEHRHSDQEEVIYRAVIAELDREIASRFGENVLPAVELQMEALRKRFAWFAEKQAAWRQQGWRIEHVEWSSEEPVYFVPGDPPVPVVGKIDRIDVHPTDGFAILDYKTGDAGQKPSQTHGKGEAGTWKDLQLPLYRHLAAPVIQDRPVQVGYFNLGKDPSRVGVETAGWTPEQLEGADQRAAEVVAEIQAGLAQGTFPHPPGARVNDAVFQALTGLSLVGAVEDSAGQEGEESE